MDPLGAFYVVQMVNNVDEAAADAQFDRRFEDFDKDPFNELSDVHFVSYFRLPKELVRLLVDIVTPFMPPPNLGPPRRVTNTKKVLIALRFFGSGSYQGITGSDAFVYVSQPSVSRSLHEVCNALNHPDVLNQWIHFPDNVQELNSQRDRFMNKYNFPGIIGCLDCTHVAIVRPPENNENYPEHVYVNRKHFHSINVQLICDDTLRIMNINARFPGSVHDARIWRASPVSQTMEALYRDNPDEMYFLLGDSGYPLRPWLQIPILDPAPGTADERYNNALKSIPSTIERCNGVLKNRFRCLLKHRVLHYEPTFSSAIINSCAVLHNMCIFYNIPEIEGEEYIVDEEIGNAEVNHENNQRNANPDLEAGRGVRANIINSYFND